MDKLALKITFEEARQLYPGDKSGADVEWKYFCGLKRFKGRHSQIIPLLIPAIKKQIAHRENATGFVPAWKGFGSWIYNSYWTREFGVKIKGPIMCKYCGEPSTGMIGNNAHCAQLTCKAAAGCVTSKYLMRENSNENI